MVYLPAMLFTKIALILFTKSVMLGIWDLLRQRRERRAEARTKHADRPPITLYPITEPHERVGAIEQRPRQYLLPAPRTAKGE